MNRALMTYDDIKEVVEAKSEFTTSMTKTYTYTDDDGSHTVHLMTPSYFGDMMTYNYGDRFFFSPSDDPETASDYFLTIWNRFMTARLDNYGRIARALVEKYNPVENYDRREETHLYKEGTEKDETTFSGQEKNELTKAGSEKTTTNYGEHTDTLTEKVSPEDDSVFYGRNQTDDKTASHVDDTTIEFTNRKDTNTTDYINRKNTTDHSFTDRQDRTESHIHGNIGVTTNAQMVMGEAEMRTSIILYERILSDFNALYTFYL